MASNPTTVLTTSRLLTSRNREGLHINLSNISCTANSKDVAISNVKGEPDAVKAGVDQAQSSPCSFPGSVNNEQPGQIPNFRLRGLQAMMNHHLIQHSADLDDLFVPRCCRIACMTATNANIHTPSCLGSSVLLPSTYGSFEPALPILGELVNVKQRKALGKVKQFKNSKHTTQPCTFSGSQVYMPEHPPNNSMGKHSEDQCSKTVLMLQAMCPLEHDAFVVRLNMSGLLKKNILVDWTDEAFLSCASSLALCHSDTRAARQQYMKLYKKCRDMDARVQPAHKNTHGKSEEWHEFCKECTRLATLCSQLFYRRFEVLHILKDKQLMLELKQQLRVDGNEALMIGHYDIGSWSETIQPDTHHTLWLGKLLKWNRVMVCRSDKLIEYSIAAWNFCQKDKTVVESAYWSLYNSCLKLDEQLAPLDAASNPIGWKEFCRKTTHLLLLRQTFMEVYPHEPCHIKYPSDIEVEEKRCIPALRRLNSRLMPAGADVGDEAADNALPTQATTLLSHCTLNSKTALLQDIKTPVNEEGCLCILDDKGFAVFRVAGTLRGAYLAGRPLLQLNGSNIEILPEDRFVLAISGVVPGRLTYVPMSGSMMATAYCTAHSHAYPARSYKARQFMSRLRSDIHGYNVETLLNLALIGVTDAVCKLKQFQFLCALYLSVGQLSLGRTIAITVDKAVLPQTSERLIVLNKMHCLQHSVKALSHAVPKDKGEGLNLAFSPALADALSDWNCNDDLTHCMWAKHLQELPGTY